jgi:hypothetical protein
VLEGGVNGLEVLADFPAELGEFGDASPGGPFQPPVEGVFAVLALELERQPQSFLQQPGPAQVRAGLGDPGELGLLAGGEIAVVLPQRVPEFFSSRAPPWES